MYDLLGGGFHRYSVDERWLVPHFEKMLYDNALLVPAYLHGWLVTGNERYREIVEETVTYMLRELALPEGGFASAQDADTDGVEGLTFTWTPDEGVPEEFLEPFEHGRFVLRGELPPELKRELFERREQRPKPLRDDKAIAAWNGLALAALAEAGRRLQTRRLARRRRGGSASSCSARSRRPTAGSTARTATASRRTRASSRTTPTSRTGSTSCTSRPASALARGVAPARAARGRAVRRRRARRLLPHAVGRRAARRAQEGLRRPPDAVGQLDARVRAAAARADLRRRRARAARGRRLPPAS